jgi:hypothetical protein
MQHRPGKCGVIDNLAIIVSIRRGIVCVGMGETSRLAPRDMPLALGA